MVLETIAEMRESSNLSIGTIAPLAQLGRGNGLKTRKGVSSSLTRSTKTDCMAYKDKNDPRSKESRRRWYYRNKDRQLSRQKVRKNFRREFLLRWKGMQSCTDCAMSFKGFEYLCDLHHVNDKKDTIGNLINHSMEMLKNEIRKCIPLCANCHRIRHAKDLYSKTHQPNGVVSGLQNRDL